jgi:hypothetical protein
MIILNLQCINSHRFEGWFASRESFDHQVGRGEVQCALCQSAEVSAMPSALRVLRSGHESEPAQVPESTKVAQAPSDATLAAHKLYQALATIARNAENVGDRFPEEARRIHYEETPARAIRGQATRDETRELLEEGILVLPAPLPPESDTH